MSYRGLKGERMSKELKQIAIDIDNYEKLRALGEMGDSFNDVVTRLLIHEGCLLNRQQEITIQNK
jgi:predicted CopG family antitoxin